MTEHPMLVIQVYPGESYQDSLLRRLQEFSITQAAVCEEMQIDPTQFSRWVARPSEHTRKPIDIGSGTVLEIETAIEMIRARRHQERQRERGERAQARKRKLVDSL
jgi:hypothetical protein